MSDQDQSNPPQQVQDEPNPQSNQISEDPEFPAANRENSSPDPSFIEVDKSLRELYSKANEGNIDLTEEMERLNKIRYGNKLIQIERLDQIFRMAESAELTETTILARELLSVRQELQNWISHRGIPIPVLLTEEMLNIVFQENDKDLIFLRSQLEKTSVRGDISIPPQSEDGQSNIHDENEKKILEELAKYPYSLNALTFNVVTTLIENLEFQFKFTTDLTKFLKREVKAIDKLKEAYEKLRRSKEKISRAYNEDPELWYTSGIFRQSIREFLCYVYEENNDLIRGILAKDMILLRTLISDMQSLFIENISIYLNKKNQVKK